MNQKKSRGQRRVCPNGHIYYKSSDCPVCPICENKKQQADPLMSVLSAPARRALENAGIVSIKQLSGKRQSEILALHGMGPSSIPKLKKVLKSKGLSFRKS